jgi:hypothetical protein
MEEEKIYHKLVKIINYSLLVLAVINSLLICCSVIMTVNFFWDSRDKNLDFLGLTRISYNSFGYICDVLLCNAHSAWILKGVINFLIISVFCIQYLILNNMNFQDMILKSVGSELEIHIKLICQIFSYFSYIMMLQVYQPASEQESIIISYVEDYKLYFNLLSRAAKIYSIFLILTSLPFHLVTKDILKIRLIFFQNRSINNLVYCKSGIYNYCLSPFRGGVIFYLISYFTILDYSKIILISFIFLTLQVDYYFEQKKFKQISEEYSDHEKSVRNKYVLNIQRLYKTKAD